MCLRIKAKQELVADLSNSWTAASFAATGKVGGELLPPDSGLRGSKAASAQHMEFTVDRLVSDHNNTFPLHGGMQSSV